MPAGFALGVIAVALGVVVLGVAAWSVAADRRR